MPILTTPTIYLPRLYSPCLYSPCRYSPRLYSPRPPYTYHAYTHYNYAHTHHAAPRHGLAADGHHVRLLARRRPTRPHTTLDRPLRDRRAYRHAGAPSPPRPLAPSPSRPLALSPSRPLALSPSRPLGRGVPDCCGAARQARSASAGPCSSPALVTLAAPRRPRPHVAPRQRTCSPGISPGMPITLQVHAGHIKFCCRVLRGRSMQELAGL